MSELAVIGAGPAGLAAALAAVRAGHRCTVFEAAPHIGGMAASFEIAGQRVDLGSHRLHPASPPEILALIADLLGGDLQERERNGRIRLHDRWVAFPLRTADLARHLPPRFTLGAAGDTLTSPLRRRRPSKPSFDAAIRASLGPTVANGFYAPYAHKLYGVPATDLDAELARRRVSANSPLAIIGRLARAARPTGRRFLYPRLGYGQIADQLADAAVDAGATLHLDSPVDELSVSSSDVWVGAGDQSGEFDAVISTAPLNRLARALDPAPPPDIIDALAHLRTRAMVLVYLVLDRDRYTPYDAHYLPTPDIATARLSEPKNYRDGPDPAGQTVLCAEVPCWPDDATWTMPDIDLGQLVAQDLLASGLPPAEPVAVEVRRLRSVYPVYERRTRHHRHHVEHWARSLDRILTTGRQGLGVPDNLHHVLTMGTAAAAAFSVGGCGADDGDGCDGGGGGIDRDGWHDALDRFANHVVED